MAASLQLVEASVVKVTYLSLDTTQPGRRIAHIGVSGTGPKEPKGQGNVSFGSDTIDPFRISATYSGLDDGDTSPTWSSQKEFMVSLPHQYRCYSISSSTKLNFADAIVAGARARAQR